MPPVSDIRVTPRIINNDDTKPKTQKSTFAKSLKIVCNKVFRYVKSLFFKTKNPDPASSGSSTTSKNTQHQQNTSTLRRSPSTDSRFTEDGFTPASPDHLHLLQQLKEIL